MSEVPLYLDRKKLPPPPRTTVGRWVWAYCWSLRGGVFYERGTPVARQATNYADRASASTKTLLFSFMDVHWPFINTAAHEAQTIQGYLAHKKPPSPRTTIGPKEKSYCKVLE